MVLLKLDESKNIYSKSSIPTMYYVVPYLQFNLIFRILKYFLKTSEVFLNKDQTEMIFVHEKMIWKESSRYTFRYRKSWPLPYY